MFNRPSLLEIVQRARADTLARFGSEELLRRSDVEIMSRVVAGISHEMHGYLDWISSQVLYDTSDEDVLKRQAATWGVFQKEAEFASGPVMGVGVVGRTVLKDTVIRRDDGVEYLVQADVEMTGVPVPVQLKALVAGAAGNAAVGTVLTIAQPIVGVTSQLTVTAPGIGNGSDIEPIPVFRARFLRELRRASSGGSTDDYVTWALQVPGVTRAWVYPAELGPGTVTVRFLRDGDDSPIPDAGEVAAVKASIESVKPVTAELTVAAPTSVPQTFEIVLSPGTAAVRAAVVAELKDLLLREAEPGKTILLSHIREAISIAAGEDDHVLLSPTANLTFGTGEMATFGGVVWG